jgi:hypothetical protein
METLKYKAIITGPKEYLKDGFLVEDFEITEEEVLEVIEEDESSEDVIDYLIQEYCAEWEQRWCKVSLVTEEEFEKIKRS